MGNCHFKTEFDQENVTGKQALFHVSGFLTLPCSLDESELQLSVLCWQRRLWKGVEGRTKEIEITVCNEGNVEGQNHHQEKYQVSYE